MGKKNIVTMKKTIFSFVISALLATSVWGIERRFGTGFYEFDSSKENKKVDEQPMSVYKDGFFVFFRDNIAYKFKPGKNLDLSNVEECPELTSLGIQGTFAYDRNKGKLYFSKKDSQGNSELYEATEDDGKWKDVKKLKIKGTMAQAKEVHGSSLAIGRWNHYVPGVKGFYNPCIGRAGRRIYFSGEFMAGKGGRDIWYIDQDKDEEGMWTKPEPAGDEINSQNKEDYPFVVADTALYFACNKVTGKGGMDIYVSHKGAKEKDWGKPENLGELFNTGSDEYNIVGNAYAMYFLSNRKGGKGGFDIYYPNKYNVKRTGELTPDFTCDEPKGFHWVLFFFDFGKADMKPEYEAQLDELLRAMNEFPGGKFEISGHTDARGSAEFNKKLSQKRAEYVRSLLIAKGYPANLIVAVGRGMEEPVIPNAQLEEEHEQNRRVDIKLLNE